MQPAQMSLLPEQPPAPASPVLVQLPEPHVAAAIAELARLIANAVTVMVVEVDDD